MVSRKIKPLPKLYLPTEYFNIVCRVCLLKRNVLIPIDEISLTHNLNPKGSVINVNLKTVFQKFCNIEVTPSDNKPQKICEFCINMGCKAFNFFQLCLYSNEILDQKLKKEISISQKKLTPSTSVETNICVSSEDVTNKNDYEVNSEQTCQIYVEEVNLPMVTDSVTDLTKTHVVNGANTIKTTVKSDTAGARFEKDNCPIKEDAIKLLRKIKRKCPNKKASGRQKRSDQHQDNILKCRFCQKVFPNIDKVFEHFNDEHVGLKRCILCPTKFNRMEYLKYHLAAHSPDSMVCRQCRLYFENQEDLDQHKANVNHNNLKQCNICQKTLCSKGGLRKHIDTVHLKKRSQCGTCGKIYSNGTNLNRHEKIAHKKQIYLCQTCGQGCVSNYGLRKHIQKVHKINQGINVKKYPKNPKQHTWTAQMKREGGIYECNFCTKTCMSYIHYLKHCEVHPEFKDYTCDVCGVTYETRKELIDHREIHRIFKCFHPSCDKMWITKEAAYNHKYTHQKPKKCQTCNAEFSMKSQLDSHIRVHTGEKPYICQQCGTGFKQPNHLKVHLMAIHGEKKPWQCQFCDKTFFYSHGLRIHMRSHTGEKPFPCPYCIKMFRDTISRHKHVKNDHPKEMADFLIYKKQYQNEEVIRIDKQSRFESMNYDGSASD